ncbi:PAS domain S-box protein [Novosphingobium resinovorum]|uniref:PAS domain-containing sensor histidine kinase n=1 Tax=Novosphingobium resinovorum TaxID=158500 RepID=UPI002ED45DA9|nr:PAS domain S-box protein [Novosphingobium resinovorum]
MSRAAAGRNEESDGHNHAPSLDHAISKGGLEARYPEAPFRQIVQSLPAALYTTDAEGRITFYNEAAAALWGRQPRIGEDWWCGSWKLYWPDGTPMRHEDCPMAAALKAGKEVRGAEAIAQRPDGSRYWFIPYPTPLFDDAGVLIGAVNMLVDISERKQSEEAAQRLAAIVESSGDAIISKTLDGTITSWNDAAERMFGYTAKEIIGQSILTLIPQDRHGEETDIIARLRRGERVEHYETVRQRNDGSTFDISLTVSPVRRGDGTVVGASKIARDITERKRHEARLLRQTHHLETLNRVSTIISRDLDLDRIVQAVTDIGTELSGARFGAFFYNVTDNDGESYLLYTLSGAPREAFERFGMPRNTAIFRPTFEGAGVVRSDDIRKDPRYGHNPPHQGMPAGHLPVVSYLAVPVLSSSGEVLGGLFFGHDEPGIFGPETETLISAIAGQAAVAIDNARLHGAAQIEISQRRRAEEAKELLLHEIKHRVKNTLATVQAMASQTFREGPKHEVEAFIARLHALSGAHDLLTQQDWDAVEVANVVKRALRPFLQEDQERFAIAGPDVRLTSNQALLIAMTLHELGTNAVKYGALSNAEGRVDLAWEWVEQTGAPKLSLCWRESNGPVVVPPGRKGFGSRMIERAIKGEDGAAWFEFAPEGLRCTLELAMRTNAAQM